MWDGIKAPTPFHLRCPHCRQRLRLNIRGFWIFAAVMILLQLALIAGCVALGLAYGWLWFLAGIAGYFAGWMLLEVISGLIFYTWGEIVLYDGSELPL